MINDEFSPVWRKSCHASNQCVEVARLGGVAVRDSKHPEQGHVALSPVLWVGLINHIKEA